MGLKFKATVAVDVKLVGRKYSRISVNTKYNQDLVRRKFDAAVPVARRMAFDTLCLIEKSLSTLMRIKVGPGIHDAASALPDLVEKNLVEHLKAPDARKKNPTVSKALAQLQAANPNMFASTAANQRTTERTACTQSNAAEWAELLNYLRQCFTVINQYVQGPFVIEDVPFEDRADGTCGQVMAKWKKLHDDPSDPFYDPAGAEFAYNPSNVQMNFVWSETVPPERIARTIIHEIAHLRAGCDDHAYYWNTDKYRMLTTREARSNADSLAHFAICTFEGGKHSHIVG
ncbi:MAG: hypothetical protein ACKVPY_16535 [Paracoccaceae bacterium]